MKELYHYHLTLGGNVTEEQHKSISKVVKASPAAIELVDQSGNVVQTDLIITKYSRTIEEILTKIRDDTKALSDIGVNIIRTKVERLYDRLPERVVGEYLEVHLKVNDSLDFKDIPEFALSRNYLEDGLRFYNCRIYKNEDIPKFKAIIDGIAVIEAHYESVEVDTNPEMDRWWA